MTIIILEENDMDNHLLSLHEHQNNYDYEQARNLMTANVDMQVLIQVYSHSFLVLDILSNIWMSLWKNFELWYEHIHRKYLKFMPLIFLFNRLLNISVTCFISMVFDVVIVMSTLTFIDDTRVIENTRM